LARKASTTGKDLGHGRDTVADVVAVEVAVDALDPNPPRVRRRTEPRQQDARVVEVEPEPGREHAAVVAEAAETQRHDRRAPGSGSRVLDEVEFVVVVEHDRDPLGEAGP
jgi:hypothetical protein